MFLKTANEKSPVRIKNEFFSTYLVNVIKHLLEERIQWLSGEFIAKPKNSALNRDENI